MSDIAERVKKIVVEHLGVRMPDSKPDAFLATLARMETENYTQISAQVDAFAVWLSRLAEALHTQPHAQGGGDGVG
jgi:hypothetical protein